MIYVCGKGHDDWPIQTVPRLEEGASLCRTNGQYMLSRKKRVSPVDKLACRFTNGARSRWKIYRPSNPKRRWLLCILHTCDEPAFILSELADPVAFDMATEPNFGNDELNVDQRCLFTESIAD